MRYELLRKRDAIRLWVPAFHRSTQLNCGPDPATWTIMPHSKLCVMNDGRKRAFQRVEQEEESMTDKLILLSQDWPVNDESWERMSRGWPWQRPEVKGKLNVIRTVTLSFDWASPRGRYIANCFDHFVGHPEPNNLDNMSYSCAVIVVCTERVWICKVTTLGNRKVINRRMRLPLITNHRSRSGSLEFSS